MKVDVPCISDTSHLSVSARRKGSPPLEQATWTIERDHLFEPQGDFRLKLPPDGDTIAYFTVTRIGYAEERRPCEPMGSEVQNIIAPQAPTWLRTSSSNSTSRPETPGRGRPSGASSSPEAGLKGSGSAAKQRIRSPATRRERSPVDSASAHPPDTVAFIVFVHGLDGDPSNWRAWERQLAAAGNANSQAAPSSSGSSRERTQGESAASPHKGRSAGPPKRTVVRLYPTVNYGSDVDVGKIKDLGHVLAQDIIRLVRKRLNNPVYQCALSVTLSIVGHGVGGLVMRAALRRQFYDEMKLIEHDLRYVVLEHLMTLNTPHLGPLPTPRTSLLQRCMQLLPGFGPLPRSGETLERPLLPVNGAEQSVDVFDDLATEEELECLREFRLRTAVGATLWDDIAAPDSALLIHSKARNYILARPPQSGNSWTYSAVTSLDENGSPAQEIHAPGHRHQKSPHHGCLERSRSSSDASEHKTQTEKLASGMRWARFAYTLPESTVAGGDNAHYFTLAKVPKCDDIYEWSMDFIAMLIKCLLEGREPIDVGESPPVPVMSS
eukprot:CAMPEP_0170577704 /NCGR_PEP_ID=MMETSP0224-20130122/5071_1 /TAXON_ID=285029 /ORGANISM="Togula jolla, Strain CCCM 725" /LENGTH=550 /DNA_ID=CAMNT_0010900637 /DNA_START=179 /DNA_END=1831 /DNA_ORIENTATION=-